MSLRLRVVSEQRLALGSRATIEFDAAGGTIGRAADNDWVLPDPRRYVSGHHARIRVRDGRYLLEDLSTNGVFVNDDGNPVSITGPRPLEHGDVIRLGEYHIVVSVDAAGPSDTAGRRLAEQPDPVAATGAAPVSLLQTGIDAAFDIDDVLNGHGSDPARSPSDSGSGSGIDLDSAAVARRLQALARAAAKRDRILQGSSGAAGAAASPGGGLEAFCRGAGIPVAELPADAHGRLLSLAGQLVREALVGLKDLHRSRQELRNRLRIELPLDLDDDRPSLANTTVEDLLLALFNQHESRRLNAVDWLREAVAEAKRHDDASAAALREAFVGFVDRLDPSELESRFSRGARRTAPDDAAKANWELYKEFYRNLAEMPPDGLPRTFVEAFVAVYVEHLAREPARAGRNAGS